MQNAFAYPASCFTGSTPGGSAAFCARLRLFALKPFWTKGLQQIHHCTRGSAPLSNRDKSLLPHYARWTRAPFAIHPAAVFGSVVTDRALTPRLAGLRPYASLQSSSLCSLAASRDWAGRPTTERGGSRLVVTPLDGGRPHRTGMPGGTASLPHPSAERGRSSVVLSVVSRTRWGELAYKFRLRLNAFVETAPANAPWAALVALLTRGREPAPGFRSPGRPPNLLAC